MAPILFSSCRGLELLTSEGESIEVIDSVCEVVHRFDYKRCDIIPVTCTSMS